MGGGKRERSDVIGGLVNVSLTADKDHFTKGLCSVNRRHSRVERSAVCATDQ